MRSARRTVSRIRIRQTAGFLMAALALSGAARGFAAQSTTYTWVIDRKGHFVHTQDAYLPDRTVTHLALKDPEDIFITPDGLLYIGDTGNRRVLVYDIARGEAIREIQHPAFQKPRGLYVTPGGDLYVADSGAAAVFRFGADGSLLQTFARPNSPAYGSTAYAPMRVAVDHRGSLYIIGEGVANGIIQLSVTGEFLGFFTANKVTLTWIQALQNLFFTEVQKSNLQDRVPGTFANVYTDERGIVYSVTMGREGAENVKKHNMKGINMFKNGVISSDSLCDVTTDRNGVIYACDSRGWIMVYSPDGEFLFDFGGYSDEDIAGLYSYLTSVAVEPDGTIWTLDYHKAYLQSYKPTEYTLSIYEALSLFNKGYYAQAETVWRDVLKHNQSSILAHDGIGKAGLYMQQYEEAMLHFELSGNRAGYSQAYWELRNIRLQENLIWMLAAVTLFVLSGAVLRFADRGRKTRRAVSCAVRRVLNMRGIRDMAFALFIMRHPLDGYDDLKRHKRGTHGGAVLLTAALFIAMMLYQTSKAFILQTTSVEDMNLPALAGGFFGIVLLFIFSNYLVTSIHDGEGTLGDIFKLTAYATFPLTLCFLLVTALSYVITYNETFLVSFIMTGGIAWFLVTLYMGLQEVHRYSFRHTVKSILYTAGFMLIAVVALLILTILFQQMTQFLEAVGREAYHNANGMR